MKKSIKTIGTITAIGTMLVCAYLFGATQAKTVTIEKEIEKRVEVIPDGYMPLDECIPIEDVSCCFINDYDNPCFELKDVTHQLDDNNNRSYADIMKNLADKTDHLAE